MKSRTSFLTRCLALALAVMLLVSNANLGVALRVFAVEGETTVTAGELVALNYTLTDAEKSLLSSGNLVGDSYTYSEPADVAALVTVDTESKTIEAKSYDGGNGYVWQAVSAEIYGTDGALKETVTLTEGTGSYTYAEDAFSTNVTYTMSIAVDTAVQATLLAAAGNLKQGVANTDAVSGQAGNLYILEQAMPQLVDLAANPIQVPGSTMKASLSDEAIAAIGVLDDQMEANNGLLNLTTMVNAYDAGTKTGYLMTNGAAMQAEVVVLVDNLTYIVNALSTLSTQLDILISYGLIDAATGEQIKILYGSTNTLKTALDAVADDPWTAANQGTALVKADADYAELDTLVAALGTISTNTTQENLNVPAVVLTANTSMVDVAVVAVVNYYDANGAEATVSESAVIKVADETPVADVAAQAEAVDEAVKAKAAEQGIDLTYFDRSVETNIENAVDDEAAEQTYTVKYDPKEYEVTFEYAGTTATYKYGQQIVLEPHTNPDQAYDYQISVDGGEAVTYAQGTTYTVVGNTVITRATGKNYVSNDLMSVVADNYGTDKEDAILTSGALKDNTTISVRYPDARDTESILELVNGTLTAAATYPSDYFGLSWVPYSYGATGTENTFSGNTASWSDGEVKVMYRLNLTNFSVEDVNELLTLVKTLSDEAATQVATLDRLAAYYDTMAQLDKTKLGALNGVIDVTDFTPGDNTDADQANLDMRAYFKSLVGSIIDNSLDSNNYLKIYNILGAYLDENNGGLRYYYNNSAAVINEINTLSEYLTALLADDEKVAALEIMVGAAGFPEYAEKITDLEGIMSEVKAALTAPNASINLTSSNLGKLITALESEGTVGTVAEGVPYLMSDTLTALDESQVMVQVFVQKVNTAGEVDDSKIVTQIYVRDYVLTESDVADIKAKVDAAAADLLGEDLGYYVESVVETDLAGLVGHEMVGTVNSTYNWSPKTYTVVIEGEADQIVSVEDLEINLPEHPDADNGYTYEYTVKGDSNVKPGIYTFKKADLDTLFVNGTYTITRVAINEATDKLEDTFDKLNNNAAPGNSYDIVKDSDGTITGLTANVAGNQNNLVSFAMDLVNSGYTYIALNGEALLYLNNNTLEISLQTLIDALLNDNTFGSQTLIDLGTSGKGKLVIADMQLGNSADDLDFEALDFTLNLTSVPAQMTTVSNGLNAIKNYMTFKSNDGSMKIDIDLPEKVYEVYLTALLATGNVNKDDMSAVNDEIAYMFLYDYLDLIINSDANTTTYTNTLAKLGISRDLTGYEKYYQMVKKVLTNDGVVVNTAEDEVFDVSVTAKGQKAIDGLMALVGVDPAGFNTYLGMIKEYKDNDAELSASAVATLADAGTTFEAVVIDVDALVQGAKELTDGPTVDDAVGMVKGEGVANGFDYTTDLVTRVTTITGEAAVMLLGDVTGDLTFNGTTVLDLNGKTISGNVVSNGSLYIVDSSMDTVNCGGITGSVSGNVVIVGGNYSADVTAFLKDGYKRVNGVVQNALYTIETDENGNVTFVIDSNVIDEDTMPNVRWLAADIAVDLVLNYFTSAALSADGSNIYDVQLTDLIALIESTTKVDDLINKALNSVNVPGLSDFINVVLADLIDFAAIESALANNQNLATYTLTTAPWKVAVEHQTSGDYITFGITANSELAKSFDVSLRVDGDNTGYVEKLAGALADIVVADETSITVDLKQPEYEGSNNTMSVSGDANANIVIDMSADDNYSRVMAVILAYGNPDKAEKLVGAMGCMHDLKAAIGEMTIEEVFTALKKMNRNADFAAMAAEVGATLPDESAADLEEIFHLILIGVGKVLEELEITGGNQTLNSYLDEDGWFVYTRTFDRTGDVSARGYTVDYKVETSTVTVKIKLAEKCTRILGDADRNGVVNSVDAMLVAEYYVGLIDESQIHLCVSDVDGINGYNSVDSMLIAEYYVGLIEKFPIEK